MPKSNGSGKARTLSPRQIDQLLDAAPCPEQRAIWSIQAFTGSRISETLLLTWGAIHEERIVFIKSSTKTKQSREPLIDSSLREELDFYKTLWIAKWKKQPSSKEFLFPSRYGTYKSMSRQNCDLALRAAIRKAGLPSGISLHTFRRSLATNMSKKVSLKVIQKFTGHRSLNQLAEYIDVDSCDELKALAALH